MDKYTDRNQYQIIDEEITQIGRFSIHHEKIAIDDEEYPYSFIESKDSVAILGFFDEQIILIEQYRHTVDSFLLEIPGGSIEEGESPLIAARRELIEETGYEAISIDCIGMFYPVPGSMSERCYLFTAECKKKTEISTEPLERINVKLVSKEVFQKLIRGNEFKQSMGLVAWLYYSMIGGQG